MTGSKSNCCIWMMVFGALAGGFALSAAAQTVIDRREDLNFDRPEAWAMAYMSAATLFTSTAPASGLEAGALRVGVEGGYIPRISTTRRRVGFDGAKLEDLNKSPVFGRLRLTVGLPADFSLALGWTPPVKVNGVTPRYLFALALERPLIRTDRWSAWARVYHQRGGVRGDITCDRGTASFEPGTPENPFGCRAPSNDRVRLNYNGLELGASALLADRRWEPYLSLAATRMKPRVRVNAEVSAGSDRTLLVTRGTAYTATLGVVWRPLPGWELNPALAYTPLNVRRPPERARSNDDFWTVRLTIARDLTRTRRR